MGVYTGVMAYITEGTALVTGGASGIGRLMALDFAKRGFRVRVWDMSGDGIAKLEDEARQAGLDIKGTVCDVSDLGQVHKLAADLIAADGAPAVLVNNAGVVSGKPLLETPDEKIRKTLEVNTLAPILITKTFLPAMMELKRGSVVTIASAAGLIGVTGLADYSASKFGAVGFAEALRTELRRSKSGVRSLTVCPFFIDTGMFAGVRTRFPFLLPILRPEYVARRVVKSALGGRTRLIMPRFVMTIPLLRLFPNGFLDAIATFFGVNNSMDHFTGRQS